MPNTYTLIASSTVGAGGAASIDFTSIPNTYTDLQIVTSLQGNETRVSFNGVTTNLSDRVLYYVGASTVGSNTSTNIRVATQPSPANTFNSAVIYIPNYLNSSNKSVSEDSVTEDNGTTNNGIYVGSGLWSSTAAINRVTLTPSSGVYSQYSTAYLYGIKNS